MGTDRFPLEIETVLYRVLQEALTNAARHSGADTVSVILERRRDHAAMTVEDSGIGFEADQVLANSDRLGLRGMQERVTLTGGTLTIESTPGDGTTLFVRIPLPARIAGAEPPSTEENEAK